MAARTGEDLEQRRACGGLCSRWLAAISCRHLGLVQLWGRGRHWHLSAGARAPAKCPAVHKRPAQPMEYDLVPNANGAKAGTPFRSKVTSVGPTERCSTQSQFLLHPGPRCCRRFDEVTCFAEQGVRYGLERATTYGGLGHKCSNIHLLQTKHGTWTPGQGRSKRSQNYGCREMLLGLPKFSFSYSEVDYKQAETPPWVGGGRRNN